MTRLSMDEIGTIISSMTFISWEQCWCVGTPADMLLNTWVAHPKLGRPVAVSVGFSRLEEFICCIQREGFIEEHSIVF